jgi:hypothetical protein
MKNTVNVIEWFGDTIQQLAAFDDDAAGNTEAETLFTQLATENGFSNFRILNGIEDGYLESRAYKLFLVHSSSVDVSMTK